MSAARRPVTLRAPQTARLLGFTLLIANCVLLTAFDLPFERVLRQETFDIYQRWFPRERTDSPVVVVEIDERSLREIGPWPWPRTRLAQLVERLVVAGPAGPEAFAAAGQAASDAATPIDDMRGGAAQRKHLARILTIRALEGALQRLREAR